jgi:hypothetical protein
MAMILLSLLFAATPNGHVEGLDKPKGVRVVKLGKSELAEGEVTARCLDLGKSMLVEVIDPGLMGARDVWLKKKTGPAMPPCDGNELDALHVKGMAGTSYLDGTRGDFIFSIGPDAFGDRIGLGVFSATTGAMLLDVERSMAKPATLVPEGTRLWLRYHQALPGVASCDPVGVRAEACWKQLRVEAKIPDDVKLKPPRCEASAEGRQFLLAVPVEVDLNSPMPQTKRFRAGEATCEIAP